MPGIAWNRFTSSRAIARRSSAGVEPETIASATFGPTPFTPSSELEELALVGRREAVQLQRVLADDGVHLDRDLAVAEAVHRRRRVHEVADAVDVDDERLADAARRRGRAAARSRRDRPLQRRRERMADRDRERVGGVVRRRTSSRPRIAFTIFPTCSLSARPYPQTACLTTAGAYSAHATPTDDAATSTAPRACPTESAMRASAPTYDSSRATASGSCSAISSWTPVKIVSSRASSRARGDVRHQPWHVALRRPSLSWTIPYPQAAVPGSIPRTFTRTR